MGDLTLEDQHRVAKRNIKSAPGTLAELGRRTANVSSSRSWTELTQISGKQGQSLPQPSSNRGRPSLHVQSDTLAGGKMPDVGSFWVVGHDGSDPHPSSSSGG